MKLVAVGSRVFRNAIIGVVLCASCGLANAATYTWNGTSSAQWSNPGNWNPVGVPGNGDTLAFPGGASNLTNTNDLAAGTAFAALALNGSGYTLNGNGIVLSSSVSAPGGGTVNLPIDVQANAVTITGSPQLAGALSGTGPITLGTSSVGANPRFSGTGSYSGTITIFSGQLTLAGASLPSAAVVTRWTQLFGNGTVGALSNLSGFGTYIYPGANANSGTGILRTGNLTLNNGGSSGYLYVDLNGAGAGTGYDQIAVTGTVTLGTNVYLYPTAGASLVPSLNQEFVLIDNDGADAVSGTLRDGSGTTLAPGATITLNSVRYRVSYTGGTGNDVSLTVLDAPRAWTGASSALWSNPGNWNPAGLPQAGEVLLFPSGASNLTNTNDLAAGTAFAALGLNGSGYTLNGNGIVLSSSVSAPGGGTVNLPIDVQANAVTITGGPQLTGALSGTGPITVGTSGSGANPRFSGTGSYSGTITILSGQLILAGASLPSATVISRSSSLLGNGTIGALSNAIGNFAYLYPGSNANSGTGILRTGNLTLNNGGGGGQLYVDLNGAGAGTGYDQVAVTGTVTLGTNTYLYPTTGASLVPSLNQEFVLIDNDGADAVSGTLRDGSGTTLAPGATITLNSVRYRVSYTGGTGNDVSLTVLDAPRAWTGASSALWSNPGNWNPAGLPQAGEVLLFPSGASNLTNTNDLAAGTAFAALGLNGSGYTLNGNGIVLSSSVSAPGGGTVNLPIDVQANAVTITGSPQLAGALSGTGPITLGTSSVGANPRFSGTGSYSGTITIFNGQLTLAGASLPSAAVVTRWNSVAGNGTVGAVSNASGFGTYLQPGASGGSGTGILRTGNLTLNNGGGGGQLYVDLNGAGAGTGYDQVAVTGSVTLGTDAYLYPAAGASFVPSLNQEFVLIDNDGTDAVSGTLRDGAGTTLAPGATITLNGYQFTFSYQGGNGNDVTLVSQNGLPASTTALVSSLNPSNTGQQVTFTATVSGAGATPTGNVTFFDGLTALGTSSLNGSGVATLNTAALTPGTHSIVARYNGSGGYGGSSSTPLSQVVRAVFTVTPNAGTGGTLSPSTPQPVVEGNTTTFTVTPNAGYALVSVAGCGGSLVGNQFTTGPITTNCPVNATFVLSQVPSTTTLSNPSPALPYVGQQTTLSFNVTGSTPTGTVTISSSIDGDLAGCINVAVSAGTCIVTAGELAAGNHTLIAAYSGDAGNAPSSSSPFALRVVRAINLYRDDGLRKSGSAKALVLVGSFASLADALAAAQPADEVVLGVDTYFESGLMIQDDDLVVRGNSTAESDSNPWTREPVSFVDGEGAAAPVFQLGVGVTGVTLQDMGLRDVNASCVLGTGDGSLAGSNSGLTVDSLELDDCRADLASINGAGVFLSGPIDDVVFVDNEISNSAQRGLVIWDGLKTHIEFTGNYVHDMAGCCGIELQDGTASNVRVQNNRIERVLDSGMSFIGLGSGGSDPGALNTDNLIANNLLINTGRFGIEIKLPNGSGTSAGEGSIRVADNRVYLSANGDPDFDGDVEEHGLVPGIAAWRPAEERDIAGIAIYRRGVAYPTNVDIPTGVVVQDNTVKGYQQDNASSDSDGFGVVIEGTAHRVFGNSLDANDIGVQRQAGHTPYCSFAADPPPQDSNACDAGQSDLNDDYFGRGNSPVTCALVGSQTFGSNGANTRDVPAGGNFNASITNTQTGRLYCTLQSANDDAATLAGHTLAINDGAVLAEQAMITKSLRITQSASGTLPKIVAPATVSDLALLRIAAPNVEVDHLAFEVDLRKVGEAIRAVGNLPSGDPQGINLHHNTITATASAAGFVAYGRRNAISLNMSNASGYAPAAEQVNSLAVTVNNNTITGTQDWDAVAAGNQPAYFRSAIALDQGGGVIASNTMRGRDYDLFVRFTNGGGGLDIGSGNVFAGGGLYVGDGIADVRISNNTFIPDRSLLPFADFPGPVGAARWGDLGFNAMRLVNISDNVLVSGNTFSDHTNGVFAQNFVDLDLVGNTFNAPTHGTEFRHLILGTKVLSTSSSSVTQVPLAIQASSNIFHGSAAHAATAVELINHDADNDLYGALQFGGATAAGPLSNTFSGDFDLYFRLDPTTCADSSACAGAPWIPSYQYQTYTGAGGITTLAPFEGDVIALDSLIDVDGVGGAAGVYPNAMTPAQVADLQARTYHDEPIAPETPAAPAALGRVEYGLAAGAVTTTTTITSSSPNPSDVGQAFAVNATVTSSLGGTPNGTVTVEDVSGAPATLCSFSVPASTSCNVAAGLPATGVYTLRATFSNGVYANSQDDHTHRVRYATGATVTIVPASAPTAADNDYTRINNAMQLVNANVTVTLVGQFDWSPNGSRATGSNPDPSSFAYNSWQSGSDGIAGNGDDWAIEPPRNIANVVVTAAAPNRNGTPDDPTDDVYAGRIIGPGDDSAANLEGVFSLYNGAYRGWTFSNVDYAGFDLSIGMFNDGAPSDAYSNVSVLDNRFQVPADRSNIPGGDANQNIGLHFAFGTGQVIAGNGFVMDASGESIGNSANSVVMQSNTSGNALYDGLRIRDNAILIVGQQGAVPSRMLGIWENDNAYMGTDVSIERNLLRNAATSFGGGPAVVNDYIGIRFTSFSGGGKTLLIQGNRIEGFNVGMATLFSSSFTYNPPATVEAVQIVGNSVSDAGSIGVRIASSNGNAIANLAFNRFVGNAIAVSNFAGSLGANTAVVNTGRVIAEDNWWGCNGGPGVSAPRCAQTANPVSADVTVTDWLELALRSDGAATSGTPEPFDAVLSDDVVTANPGMADYPAANIAFVTSLGSVTTPVPLSTGVASNSLVTGVTDQGGALIAASYDDQTVTRLVRVCTTASGPCTFVIPSTDGTDDTPTALDNDYTRISNALQVALAGDVIELQGDFNWTEANARTSWALGSDGVAGNDDDWSAKLPAGVNDVTLRAASLGAASVLGDQGIASTDTAIFVTAFGGLNQNWSFESLTLRGFDFAFGLFASGSEDFNGTAYVNNLIEVPTDGVDDFGNYGIYTGYGQSQTLSGNTIRIDITGSDGRPLLDGGANSRYVGIQLGDSCNVDCFDDLVVDGNTIEVDGVPAVAPALPPRVIGIWENAGDGNSAITIEDNTIVGSGDLGGGVESNRQFGLIASTQSNGAKLAVVHGNHVSGTAIGFTGQLPIFGHFVSSDSPLLIEGNTFLDNGTAFHLAGAYSNQPGSNSAKYTLRFNRIAGNVIGLRAERADDLPLPGDPGYGGDELSSQISADNNWWGCNEGPAGLDCDPVVIDSGADPAVVTLDTWLTLNLQPDFNIAPLGGSVGLSSSVNTNSANADVSATTQFPAGTAIQFAPVGPVNSILSPTDPLTGVVPGNTVIGAVRSNLGSMLATQVVSAMLDSETVQATVVVEDILLSADLPAAAAQSVTTLPFPVLISNQSGTVMNEQVAVQFSMAATNDAAAAVPLVPANVLLEFEGPPGTWNSLTLTDADSNGVLEGSFPAFTLAAGNTTTNTRATFNVDADFDIAAVLSGQTTGTFYAEDGGVVAVAGPDDVRLTLLSGSPQTAPVNQAYVAPVAVRLTDERVPANALSGLTVNFAPAVGAGVANVSFATPSAISAADGEAGSGTVTANAVAGPVITARVSVPAANCSIPAQCTRNLAFTNTAATPASVTLTRNPPLASNSAVVGTAFAGQFCATVRDADGNQVPGISVGFFAPTTGASADFTPTSVLTDGTGVACTTANATNANGLVGSYNVQAQVAGAMGSNTIALSNLVGPAARLVYLTGNGQTAPVNEAFTTALAVRVTDSFDNPVPGYGVTFVAPIDGGSNATAQLSATTLNTDAQGVASVNATANDTAGNYAVTLTDNTLTPISASFGLTNVATAAATLTLTVDGGATDTATVATANAYTFVATALDADGNPVPGVSVSFAAATGAIDPVNAVALTNTLGVATFIAASGERAGVFTVTAQTAGAPAATVQVTNTADTAIVQVQVTLVAGESQTATVSSTGTDFGIQPQAFVGDRFDNPLSGVDVTFTAATAPSGATATPSPQTVATDVNGLAASASLGPNGLPGTYAFTANLAPTACDTGGVTAICADTTSLTNLEDVPEMLALVSNVASAVVNTPAAYGLTATVRDAQSNLLQGVSVTFVIETGTSGAGATPITSVDLTDATGVATATLASNTVAGDFTVRAVVSGVTDATVSLSNTPAAASQLLLVSGSGQTAPLNGTFGSPLLVRATDTYGNPVAGEVVTFTANPAGNGATATFAAAAATGANGQTGVLPTANNLPGNYTVTASAGSFVATVNFGLANTASAPTEVTLTIASDGAVDDVGTPGSFDDEAVVGTPGGVYNLSATVTDGVSPVPGVSVTFVIEPATNGAGALPSNVVDVTDAAGLATASFNADDTAGDFVVRAVVSGVTPDANDEAVLTNLADVAATIQYLAGDAQTAAVGAGFAPLQVRVVDQFGNAVPTPTSVSFTATAAVNGASAIVASPVMSGAGGIASSSATANATAGSYQVTAAFNASSVVFNLTNAASGIAVTAIRWNDTGTATTIYANADKSATFTTTPTGMTCTTTYNGSATLPRDAGQYLVQVSCQDGAGGLFGQGSATLTIAKADSGITLTGGAFNYDGVPKAATVSNPNAAAFALIYAGTGTTTYGPSAVPPTNAGDYAATLTVADANYQEVPALTAAITISPANLTLGFGNLVHVYDSTAKAASVISTPAGVTGISLAYSQGPTPVPSPVDAGDYTVTATLSNPNYTLTGVTTATLVIAKATAQVTLTDLTQVFDGQPRPVTVSTSPASLAVAVTYAGNPPPAPSAVGSYAVVATVNDINYQGSAAGTLTILSAPLASFVIDGSDTFAGNAGSALAGLPVARALDSNGAGVAGVTVLFEITAGGGSGTVLQALTNASGRASPGSWTLGRNAGVNTMSARVPNTALPTLRYTANGAEVAGVSLTKSSATNQAQPGDAITYSIVVSHAAGPSNAAAVDILDELPVGLDILTATWSCAGTTNAAGDTATCDVTNGVGDVDLTVGLPVGTSVTVTLTATVKADVQIGPLVNSAMAILTSSTDPDTSNNEDDHSVNVLPLQAPVNEIFRDGFEQVVIVSSSQTSSK